MANTSEDLLLLFTPNDTNNIQAQYLQQFVTDIYNQAGLIDDIQDNFTSEGVYNKTLSAGRGFRLNELITEQAVLISNQQVQIDDLLSRVSALEAV